MAAAPVQLPRGRHDLSREQVVASQRGRMIAAMAEAAAENGYAATSVADVIKRAGVSRLTFYEQFRSKDDCFAATYEFITEAIVSQAASPQRGSRAERVDRFLDGYLGVLAAAPALARVFLVEVYAAGPDVLARRAQMQAAVTDRLATALGARTAAQRFACEALVGAVISMVTQRIVTGDADAILELREPLGRLVEDLTGGWAR